MSRTVDEEATNRRPNGPSGLNARLAILTAVAVLCAGLNGFLQVVKLAIETANVWLRWW